MIAIKSGMDWLYSWLVGIATAFGAWLVRLEVQRNQVASDIAFLRVQVSDFAVRLAALDHDHASLDKDITVLRTEYRAMRDAMARVEQKLDRLLERIER